MSWYYRHKRTLVRGGRLMVAGVEFYPGVCYCAATG